MDVVKRIGEVRVAQMTIRDVHFDAATFVAADIGAKVRELLGRD